LKNNGVRYVPVSREALAGLTGTARETPAKTTLAEQKSASSPPLRGGEGEVSATRKPMVNPTPAPAKKIEPPPPVEQADFLKPSEKIATPASLPALSPEAKAAAFLELRQRALACVKCEHLASSRKNVVFGVGDIHSQIMFVGEAPGADEDEQGEPF